MHDVPLGAEEYLLQTRANKKSAVLSPPQGLPDTKCHSLLYHSHPFSSFLALRSPIFLLRIVTRRGHGYAYFLFLQCILWPLPNLMALSSSHTILSAKIRVGSQRTCCRHAAMTVSRFIVCFALHFANIIISSFFVAFTMWPLQPGGTYFGPSSVQDSNLCKCNSVTYSLLSACSGCQGGTWIPYDSCRCYLLNSWDLSICP